MVPKKNFIKKILFFTENNIILSLHAAKTRSKYMRELNLLLYLSLSAQLKPQEFSILAFIFFDCLQFGTCEIDNRNIIFQVPVKMSRARINQALSNLVALGYVECDDFSATKRTFTMNRIISKFKGL